MHKKHSNEIYVEKKSEHVYPKDFSFSNRQTIYFLFLLIQFQGIFHFFPQDQFIKYNGYEAEIHNVTTEDGYILKMFRCYSKAFQSKERKPAILQHGLGSSSDAFVINPGNESLGK